MDNNEIQTLEEALENPEDLFHKKKRGPGYTRPRFHKTKARTKTKASRLANKLRRAR